MFSFMGLCKLVQIELVSEEQSLEVHSPRDRADL